MIEMLSPEFLKRATDAFERVIPRDYAGPWHRPPRVRRSDAPFRLAAPAAVRVKRGHKPVAMHYVEWHGAHIAWEYYSLLRELPSAEFGVPADACSAVPVRFADGGMGAVMPLRQ
jgi:hypothetical protein